MDEHEVVSTPVGELTVRVTGNGPAALLWHSLFVDDRSWDGVTPELVGSRRLLLITGPGHGRSTDPGRRYTLAECAAAARTILAACGVSEPVDWVGNAWGGHVGIEFAATSPSRCRSLVTVGTPVAALTRGEKATTLALLGIHRLLGPTRLIMDGVTEALLSPHTRASDPAAVSYVHDCLRNADPRRLRNAVVSISLRRPDLTARLPRLTQPTLVVTGKDHVGFTPEQAEEAAVRLREGRAVVVPDAAYLVPLEAPKESASLILDFWESVDGR